MEKGYFAAANTTGGFVSYYNDTFRGCDRIYVIKGGSGTGKSRFMRAVAEYVKRLPECQSVEYFYCSFDPNSLDGIIINEKTAIIDGTAPHVYEPTMPGAREDIVDLGRFWDRDRLMEKREDLNRLFSQKRSHFARAYKYLGAYGELDGVKQAIVLEYADFEKIRAEAAKLVSEIGTDGEGDRKIRLVSAVGRDGRVELDTYEKYAGRIIEIPDAHGSAHIFLTAVIDEAARFSLPISVSYDPLFVNRPNAVLVDSVAIVARGNADGDMYFKKGISVETNRIKRINALQGELLLEGTEEFRRAARVHFGIEEIYVGSMDFKRKEEFTAEFIAGLKI